MQPPSYFDKIRRAASERWDQLDRDPELAGPWHQLFRQVQSPRHVVSELLQNADDAGALSASVRVEGNTFIFEHDGRDFDQEQFASLCRFGFSNKRNLHTIGFRGVGFKSTFSLGDTIEVHTQTLAVRFQKKRFTQPLWLKDERPALRTVISVPITDQNRAAQLRKNFGEWAESPASLLFFNNLKELTIEGRTITSQILSQGPFAKSSWVKLAGGENDEKLLVIQSDEVAFPAEAVEEIRTERGVGSDDLHLPPCRVEVVLGLSEENRLYVVLPTGAGLDLPFSCNAPFIQDPARFAIKDPATSPTNRWLLQRAGKLVGAAMLQWLGNDELSLSERAKAYDLLKAGARFAPDLSGVCSQIIVENMLVGLKDQAVVLTAEGELARAGECASVPADLFSVWGAEQLRRLFASTSKHVLAPEASGYAGKLASYGLINTVDTEGALQCLEQCENAPRPASWPQLHALWSFVQERIQYDWNNDRRRKMRIVPVDGSKVLHAANSVVRLSSRRDLLSPQDWKFVMNHTPTLNGEWVTWLAKKADTLGDGQSDPATRLLQALALHEPSSVDRIASQASLRIFSGKEATIEDCVRVAHIMAALGATIPKGFQYVARDGYRREPTLDIVVDETGRIEDIVPAAWAKEHLLHQDYSRNFSSCKPEVWQQWIKNPASKLLIFAPLTILRKHLHSRPEVRRFVSERGGSGPEEFHYQRDSFTLEDFGFPPDLMSHWENRAKNDPAVWAAVAEGILITPQHVWAEKTQARILHNGTSYSKPLSCGLIPASWISHLRTVPCLPDSHGKLHAPSELLVLTPATEPLRGVEPFVRLDLDTERTKPLLKLLGVRDTPADADKLLSRLHALSADPQPLQRLPEISRYYEALDRIVGRCATAELNPIREAFGQKAIILSDSGEWLSADEVSVFPDDENVSPSIHPSVRSLALWPRVGVSERPALERTLEWLNSLEEGTRLDATVAKRVRAALQRDSVRIWSECQHWLTLDSTWAPVGNLKYRVTMQSLMKWGELFPAIKGATANLQMLSVDVAQHPPFSTIQNLGDAVEFRVTRFTPAPPRTGCPKEWLEALAVGLGRVKLSSNEETQRVRGVAQRLQQTVWRSFDHLNVTPYVEGTPSGEPFTPKVLWQGTELYVAGVPTVSLYKELADELARPFEHKQVADAIVACIDRTPKFIAEYLDAHFDLDAQPEQPASKSQPNADKSAHTQDAGSSASEPTPADLPQDEPEDEEDADEETDDDLEDVPDDAGQQKAKSPPKPKLIELYARQRGFRRQPAGDGFIHADGRRIEKAERPFHWEESDGKGNVVRLWITDHRLAAGVEVDAELWNLITRQPSTTAVLLPDGDHGPCLLSGHSLLKLKDEQRIAIFPARYRLIESNDR